MGYMHIDNLYKNIDIMLFKECYALEKIHGTSAHISWRHESKEVFLNSGGEKYEKFAKLFNIEELKSKFLELFQYDVVVYGEAYGGKCKGMSETYGKELKFVVFEVKVGDRWLDVPNAEDVTKKLRLEFVDYLKITTDIESINYQRDRFSVQAVRNGMPGNKIREGVVLRPLIEVTKNNGDRIIVKHKNDEFIETATKREVDPAKLKIIEDANKIANEWCTPMRLNHVLDKLGNPDDIKATPKVIKAMIEDVIRESEGEIMDSREARVAIGKLTAKMFKDRISKIKLEDYND